MEIAVSAKNLKKSFDNTEVFKDFSIDIEKGKITAVFGPNGAGKSTLLNILSGITKSDGGSFSIKDFDKFKSSYIFQNYRESLLPWRTNFENVALPLEVQKKSREEIKQKVEEIQKIFEFKFDWNKYPYELSGGQQQILAFMRALITNPSILFIDEPFSALDYENNLLLREHLQRYYLAFKPTILLITHNIEEAVHLAEKIVIFSKKPTTVIETIDNPLPYPRTVQSLKAEEFHKVKDRVLSVFQKAANL
ncbi:MAG: ABC transporter ATP-binding protein [Candidatus Staskawiczbacteria bacterium]|nr:ABC transporter ATP-binding protein [Candidatus Staskawiczbacteria bacterium]